MMISLLLKRACFCALLLLVTLGFSSCQKEAGHVIPGGGNGNIIPTGGGTTGGTGGTGGGSGGSGSGPGVGPVGIGGTNTIILLYKGTTYTFATPTYFQAINSLQVPMTAKYSTTVSAFDMMMTNYFSINYDDTVPGTYFVKHFDFSTTGINLQQGGHTGIYTKVVTESIHVTSTQTNQAAGVVKGTFDGYVTDTNSANSDSVKVSGSFNISQ